MQANSSGRLPLQVWLVAADCCCIGLQPVLVHLSKNANEGYSYHPISVNILIDLVRLGFAIIMLTLYVRLCNSYL